MTSIYRLDWDSSFFGYEVGRLNVSSNENFDYVKFKAESKMYRLIYIYSEIALNLNDNFKLMDEKVMFIQKIGANVPDPLTQLNFLILPFNKNKDSISQLRQLALQSGLYSRFNLDVNFKNNEYQKLYLEWLDKSVNGTLAFDVLIAKNSEKILGFTTLGKKSEKLADIGLVAVDNTYRGQGIGMDLINKTIKRASLEGYNEIQVVTQMTNTPAVKLYEKTNFKIKEKMNIYHYWNQ